MKHFTPEQKHEILMEYQPYSRTHSFSSLALRHSVHDGGRTVRNWYQRWDGTVASLQQTEGAGRPNILTPTEAAQYSTAHSSLQSSCSTGKIYKDSRAGQ